MRAGKTCRPSGSIRPSTEAARCRMFTARRAFWMIRTSSLIAAAHPDDGDAVYFVATGDADGSHVFSRTLVEHNAAVAAYISRLKQKRRAEQRGEQGN